MAKTGAHPGDIVVPPGDRQVRLMHEDLDHLIETRTTIPQVAGNHDFENGQMPDHPGRPAHGLEPLIFMREGIEHRINVCLRTTSLGFPEELTEKRLVIGWESPLNVSQAIPLRQRG